MKVYLRSKQDWINFVNGRQVRAFKNSMKGCYKTILVAFNEVILDDMETVIIEKKY